MEDPNNLRFCDQTTYDVPFLTLFKLSGTYPLPYGIRASAVFQSIPGAARQLTYQVTRTQLPTLDADVGDGASERAEHAVPRHA